MSDSKNILVGRGEQADFQANDPYVSRCHAKLTRDADGIYIEDLGSTGGTFVNGRKVLKRKINLSDEVRLGDNYLLNITQVLSQLPLTDVEYQEAFTRLKQVYETYNKEKVKLQTDSQSKVMLKRSLPMAIPGGLIWLAGAVTDELSSKIIGAVLSMLAVVLGSVWASKEQSKTPQRLQELDEQFKIDYACPGCHKPFGSTPWESMRKQGKCPYCQRKFNTY